MNRPSFTAYLVGNPLMVLGLSGATIAAVYQCWTTHLSWGVVVVMVLVTGWSYEAADRISAYRAWKREWDGLGDGPGRPSVLRRKWQPLIGLATAALLGWYLYEHQDEANNRMLLGLLGLLLAAALLRLILLELRKVWARRRSRAHQNAIVAIAIARPLMKAEPLKVAFRRLPPHCHQAMQAPQIKAE